MHACGWRRGHAPLGEEAGNHVAKDEVDEGNIEVEDGGHAGEAKVD